ncbi:hypothetical protein OSC52_15420 [Clostridium pasteurianum]|uniref:hypothetical protein n=1 Tax=Clostridium pasteurianum TaxID=1501 RepID=UPI0022609F7F|nr:hypothetical protein [Clostridium pasteurianum]UZW13226.1 hypothetical protein OSC52_15420 [Clostridium pasteurianum]
MKKKTAVKWLRQAVEFIQRLEDKELFQRYKVLEEENQVYIEKLEGYSKNIERLKKSNKNMLSDLEGLVSGKKNIFFKSKVPVMEIQSVISKYQGN